MEMKRKAKKRVWKQRVWVGMDGRWILRVWLSRMAALDDPKVYRGLWKLLPATLTVESDK